MRIRMIVPPGADNWGGSSEEGWQALARSGVELEVVCPDQNVYRLESGYDEAVLIPVLLEEVARAEKEGCHAVVVVTVGDVGLWALKQAARIPVVSTAEAGLLCALALGDKFSVLTGLPESVRAIEHGVRAKGLQDRMASVVPAHVSMSECVDPERLAKAFLAAARHAVAEDGADVIVLGCGGMPAVARALSGELPVPVVDPADAGVELARSLVSMGLVQSRVCFPPPRRFNLGRRQGVLATGGSSDGG